MSKKPHGVQGGSSEANRFAVVILEVLAGGRTPGDAAKALGVTPPRYYQLETRALEGLVAALEPRPKGKQPSLEGRIAQLEKALGEARRESLRQQALVRAAQRSLGIKPGPTVADGKQAGQRRGWPQEAASHGPRIESGSHTGPGYSTAGGGNATTGKSNRPSSGRSAGKRRRAAGGRSTAFEGTSG